MKRRFLAVLLSLLLLGLSVAGAEETAVAKNFGDGLSAWAKSLDLNRADYHGQVLYQGESVFDAKLRKDGELFELALQDLGRAQFSDRALAVEFNGQKYYIDLASLLGLIQPLLEDGISVSGGAGKDRILASEGAAAGDYALRQFLTG